MQAPKSKRWNRRVLLIVAVSLLQGCSALPQLVRHSDPLTAEEHVKLGTSYEVQGQKDYAVQQYKAALHLQKNNIPALVSWGNLAFENADWKNAEACYRRILRLEPTHAGANNNLAMVYLSTGKHIGKAETLVQIALKQGGPLKPYALDTLATIYIQEGRFPEAQKALDEATAPENNQQLRDQLAKTREKLVHSRIGV